MKLPNHSSMSIAAEGLDDSRVSGVLEEAWRVNRQGDRPRAYELSLQVTQSNPDDIQAWMLRATTAPSLEEKIVCLNQINRLNPQDPFAQRETYESLKTLLKKDPFIAYLDQSEHLYQVHNGIHMMLTVPKDRAVPEPYPAQRPKSLKSSNRWLWLALFGFLAAGVGTLIFAPMAAINALRVDYSSLSYSDRMRGYIILALSILMTLLAIPLVGLLLLHIF